MPPEPQLPHGFQSRAFLQLALPMIISRSGLAAMGIADGIMVARFQAREFAWMSLAEGTLEPLLAICMAFLIGGLTLVARHFAKGDKLGARAIWLRTAPVAMALGGVVLLVGLFGSQLLTLLGQKHELVVGAAPVMIILGFGYPGALLAIAAGVYLEGVNRPRIVAICVVIANILNVALNWLFIGGHLGFAAMGARGSALSTTLMRCLLALILFSFAWRLERNDRKTGTETYSAEREESRKAQWKLGLGAAITVAATVTLTVPLTLIAARLGVLSLATFSAAWNLAGPAGLLALGMADAAGIYVAAEAARSGLADAARVAWSSLRLTLVPVVAAAAVFAIWAPACAAFYTIDSNLRRSMTAVIPVVGLILLVDCIGFAMVSSLRALRESLWPTGIETSSMLLVVPVATILALHLGYGVKGLFVAMLVAGIVRAAFLLSRFSWLTRDRNGTPKVQARQWSVHVE